MTSHDEFGDRMKMYEGLCNQGLLPRVPVLARLDGRNFHSFTKHAARPFSESFHALMLEVTRHLVAESVATVGYTQSDEITLCWTEHPFFEGNVHKMVSTLAAMASVHLHGLALETTYPDGLMGSHTVTREAKSGLKWGQAPTFDCRVWVVPSRVEATNVFLWRQQDAARNSVQMAARHHLGHAACNNKDTKLLQEMLFEHKNINWNDYPAWAKRGIFVKHAKTRRSFTAEEIEALPPKHYARSNPDLVVERRVLDVVDIDLRSTVDRDATLFTDATCA
jgi:tRNA(His) guanylyltransferase